MGHPVFNFVVNRRIPGFEILDIDFGLDAQFILSIYGLDPDYLFDDDYNLKCQSGSSLAVYLCYLIRVILF